MDKKTFQTLTEFEINSIVQEYASLIELLEHKASTVNLKKELTSILRHIPEELHLYGQNRRGHFSYYEVLKKAGAVYYYSDGRVMIGARFAFMLDPWKPLKAVKEDFQIKSEAAKDLYENKPSVEELAAQDSLEADQYFHKQLNKRNNLCLKYQMNKYLGKSFKVPKRFFWEGKKFCELATLIKMTVEKLQSEDAKKLELRIKESVNIKSVEQLLNVQYSMVDMPYFPNVQSILDSIKYKAITYYAKLDTYVKTDNCNKWTKSFVCDNYNNRRSIDQYYSAKISRILDIYNTLKLNRNKMPEDVKAFFVEIGLLEQEDNTSENDVSV